MTFDKTRNAGFLSAAFCRNMPGKFLGLPSIIAQPVKPVAASSGHRREDRFDKVSVVDKHDKNHRDDHHFLNYNSTITAESFEAIFRETLTV
jgi:hypothetical protein